MSDLHYIYRIVTKDELDHIHKNGCYKGSEHDVKSGFIHLSTTKQLKGTIEKKFKNSQDVISLKIDYRYDKIAKKVKWEFSASRGEDFAHYYDLENGISTDCIVSIKEGSDGILNNI
jgi:uncharacterized protein (DUF952 family)